VIHGYAEAEGELSVTAAMQDGELAIVIGDTGPGLVERRDSPAWGSASLSSQASPSG
jgi:anti-sigma regulatory factor (Ser/Thr protein kinase)